MTLLLSPAELRQSRCPAAALAMGAAAVIGVFQDGAPPGAPVS